MSDRISFRIGDELKRSLLKQAEAYGMSLSDYIRTILSQNVEIIPEDWKLIMWNILGVDTKASTRSLKRSSSPEDFFAGVLRHFRKGVSVKPLLTTSFDTCGMSFTVDGKEYSILVERTPSLQGTIRQMVLTLEKMIMEGYDEEAEEI